MVSVPEQDIIHLHLWDLRRLRSLLAPKSVEDHFSPLLSDDEKERWKRLRLPEAAEQFLAARGLLRTFLASLLQKKPEEIRFGYEKNGRPFVLENSDNVKNSAPPVYFSVSHSGPYVAMAFGKDPSLGVDVEVLAPRDNLMGLARRYFHEKEYEAFLTVPPEEQMAAFYHTWTIKEAFLKALGFGMEKSPRSFSASPWGETPIVLTDLSEEIPQEKTHHWTFHRFLVENDGLGTLAFRGSAAVHEFR